ncbi:DUF3145 domain-containing protein [Propionibacteriaceae bacterium Y1923]|uniref:DUF3145 domain-containing protein n=1 Tax=Aestuariimicrobium sp. Y1814 TaxID=3418742 RepID=UPI003C223B4D
MSTRGIIWIHSSPAALRSHVEWALAGVLGVPAHLEWSPQPVERGSYRAELEFDHHPGTAAAIASAFRKWGRLRFEVTEEPSNGHDGQRYSFTPALGIFHAGMGVHGDLLVSETDLQQAMAHGLDGLEERLAALLGTPWDEELEAFRHAGDGSTVRWLHQVG